MFQKIVLKLDNLYKSKYSFIYLIIFQFIFRIPYFFHSEKRMHGDEAFHWLVNQTILKEEFILRPFNHNYLGVFDFLFALPFVPFFENSGLSNQLGLLLLYFLFAFFSIQIAKLVFNELTAKIVYFYFFIPSSFLMIMSATYHGGHFGSAVFFLAAVFFHLKFIFENKYYMLFISGIFFGVSYYNSHLTLMVIFTYLFFLNIYLFLNSRKFFYKILILFLIGLGIGLIPELLGKYFSIGDFKYNSIIWDKPFYYFKNNFIVLRDYGLDTIIGILAHPFMRYYGFFYGEFQQTVIHYLNILIGFSFIFFILKSINPFKNFSSKLKDIRYYFDLVLLANLGLNLFLILYLNRKLDDFGIRYLMPTVCFSTIILFYKMSEKKTLVPFLIYFFCVNFFGYLQGYTKNSFYDFEGSPGSIEVSKFLKVKKIKYSFANHWIAYNLVKNSNREHLSSPFFGENIHYMKLHDLIWQKSKAESIALVQMDVLFDWFSRHLILENGFEMIQFFSEDDPNFSEGKYKILDEQKIDRWRVFILEKINE